MPRYTAGYNTLGKLKVTSSDLPASRAWSGAFVALLVSLGAELVAESVLRAAIDAWFEPHSFGVPYAYGLHEFATWCLSTVVRFISFALGGFVGVRFARGSSKLMVVILLLVSALAALFEQFPSGPLKLAAVWAVAAPMGSCAGAWLASWRSRVA